MKQITTNTPTTDMVMIPDTGIDSSVDITENSGSTIAARKHKTIDTHYQFATTIFIWSA